MCGFNANKNDENLQSCNKFRIIIVRPSLNKSQSRISALEFFLFIRRIISTGRNN
jgi:hypothetical protein